ncbi:helix-turn-helix domain-containing protein [Zobellia roscoffensis]|uniref:helix-turn-helix domain-containing protein n=1 Tax=Zobellia roscoffensis TaxID=2779508 RepID=UPI00188C9629|nr:helix-turn-helix domain-containing protein [Zobellia roscoffensis]
MHTSFNNKSIAVLPFLTIGDKENEYFSDGITEEIINALTKIEGLKVTARTSSFFYKNKPLDARHIGNELGVETLLEGSVRCIKERVRITAQLIRTDNGFHIWCENFDRNLTDIFALQDEISLLIADKIRENFGHLEVQDSLVDHPNISPEAYGQYLRAKSLVGGFNKDDIRKGINLLKKITEQYPNFALGYVHMHYAYNSMAAGGLMPVKEAFEIGEKYLEKAQQLNMEFPEVYHSLGWHVLNRDWDFKNAVAYLKKAIALKPNYADAHQKLFITLILEGNLTQADHHIKEAYKLDPLYDLNNYFMGYNSYIKRDHEKVRTYFKKCFELNPKFLVGYGIYALALLDQNRPNTILEVAKTIPDMEGAQTERRIMRTLALSAKGVEEECRTELSELTQLIKTDSKERVRFFLIFVYTKIHQYEKALDLIDEGISRKEPLMTLLKVDPLLKPLHSEERFKNALGKIFALSNANERKEPEKTVIHLLSPTDADTFMTQLKNYMTEEMPFLKADISLRNLAGEINLHPNKLSWLLNEKLGQNFNDFINSHRVEHFKDIALHPANSHITLLGLAYDSGFNSKTVFNTFFKKETGMTPKQWVNSQR